jgi:hypothetical protein
MFKESRVLVFVGHFIIFCFFEENFVRKVEIVKKVTGIGLQYFGDLYIMKIFLPNYLSLALRDFRHEKTKKKRGTYRGGQIDLQSHSFKFNYSDED